MDFVLLVILMASSGNTSTDDSTRNMFLNTPLAAIGLAQRCYWSAPTTQCSARKPWSRWGPPVHRRAERTCRLGSLAAWTSSTICRWKQHRKVHCSTGKISSPALGPWGWWWPSPGGGPLIRWLVPLKGEPHQGELGLPDSRPHDSAEDDHDGAQLDARRLLQIQQQEHCQRFQHLVQKSHRLN